MSDIKNIHEMIHPGAWAEDIVSTLVGGRIRVSEDRIKDIIDRYPEAKLDRHTIQGWFEYDPTDNKKFVPWIIKEVAEKRLELPAGGHELRDLLMTFERLMSIPAYTGQRDIYQLNLEQLRAIVSEFGTLKSKTSQEKAKREAGVEEIAKSGNITCLKITDVQALNNWSWKAYSADNPNWNKEPVLVGSVATPFVDHLWCTRFPQFATSYLSAGPFYLILKNGGPYAGLVPSKGEAQTLTNEGITTAMAEEMFPVVKDILPKDALNRNMKVFANIRFLHNEVKPGETIQGPIELKDTQLSQLPSNLTINGSLDISNTPIAALPQGLKVAGTLKINGTRISDFPNDISVEDMEWSAPLDWKKVKLLFYRLQHQNMKEHYMNHKKLANASPEKKEQEWIKFQPRLVQYFQTHPNVDKNVRSVYRLIGKEGEA